MSNDHVGQLIEFWRANAPEADLEGLELSGRLQRLEHAMGRVRAEVLSPHGLDAREWDVLSALWRGRARPVSMSDLAAELLVVAGSVTNRVSKLERRGLVERKMDPESRRRVLVTLTEEGAARVQTVVPVIVDASTRLSSLLPTDVIRELNDMLRQATAVVEGAAMSGSQRIRAVQNGS